VPIRYREKEKSQAFLYLPYSFCDFYEVKKELESMKNDDFCATLVRLLESETDNDRIAKEHLRTLHNLFVENDKSEDEALEERDIVADDTPNCPELTRLELRDSQNKVTDIDNEFTAYQALGQKYWNEFTRKMKEQSVPQSQWPVLFWSENEKSFPILARLAKHVIEIIWIVKQ